MDDGKRSAHRFHVGDAFGVGAPHETFDRLGYFYGPFFDYILVLDDVHGGHRRNDRDAVDLLLLAETFVDLDDRFGSHPLAFEVHAEGNAVRLSIETQYLDDFEQAVGRNVVDHGTVFDCPDF